MTKTFDIEDVNAALKVAAEKAVSGTREERAGMASSVIRDYDYDDAQRELTIYFVTGRVYVYRDVPAEVFAEFESSPSKGGYFNTAIRDAYAFEER